MNKQIIRCENCIHNGVCYLQEVCENIVEQLDEFGCEDFADKSLYIKLPCKIGDTIFGIYAHYECRNKKGQIEISEFLVPSMRYLRGNEKLTLIVKAKKYVQSDVYNIGRFLFIDEQTANKKKMELLNLCKKVGGV